MSVNLKNTSLNVNLEHHSQSRGVKIDTVLVQLYGPNSSSLCFHLVQRYYQKIQTYGNSPTWDYYHKSEFIKQRINNLQNIL